MRLLSSWNQLLATSDEAGVQIHQYANATIRAEIPAGPEEEAELDFLLRGLKSGPESDRVSALSAWVMKRRAGAVGERLGRELLAPLWRSTAHPPRLHDEVASSASHAATNRSRFAASDARYLSFATS